MGGCRRLGDTGFGDERNSDGGGWQSGKRIVEGTVVFVGHLAYSGDHRGCRRFEEKINVKRTSVLTTGSGGTMLRNKCLTAGGIVMEGVGRLFGSLISHHCYLYE